MINSGRFVLDLDGVVWELDEYETPADRRLTDTRAGWDESKHPRRPDGKFGKSAGIAAVDRKLYRDAFLNESDPQVRAADFYSDTIQGMNLVRIVMINRDAGRDGFDNGDGSNLRDSEDYYLAKRHVAPIVIKDFDGNVVYGPEQFDQEISNAADHISAGINKAEPVSQPLSRGMRISQWDLPEVGDKFDIGGRSGVTSWTTDPNRADNYSALGDIWEDGRRVRITTTGPIPAFDLGSKKRHSRTGDDGEHLIGGGQNVRVVSIEKQGDGPKAIFEIVVEAV